MVIVSLRCPEKHIKSLQKSTPPKFEKNLLEIWKKNVYIIEKKIILAFYNVPSYRKLCEDHESPHFYGSTIISFRVIGNLKIDFSGLVFFSEKKSDFIFRIFGLFFF